MYVLAIFVIHSNTLTKEKLAISYYFLDWVIKTVTLPLILPVIYPYPTYHTYSHKIIHTKSQNFIYLCDSEDTKTTLEPFLSNGSSNNVKYM